jgi:hypothetical protein
MLGGEHKDDTSFELLGAIRETLDDFVDRHGGSLPLGDVLCAAGTLLVHLTLENEVDIQDVLESVRKTHERLVEFVVEEEPN